MLLADIFLRPNTGISISHKTLISVGPYLKAKIFTFVVGGDQS